MEYSKSKSSHNVKNGHIDGLQRYKCKDCGRSLTGELKSTAKPEDVKRQALLMYLEGLGRTIKFEFVHEKEDEIVYISE